MYNILFKYFFLYKSFVQIIISIYHSPNNNRIFRLVSKPLLGSRLYPTNMHIAEEYYIALYWPECCCCRRCLLLTSSDSNTEWLLYASLSLTFLLMYRFGLCLSWPVTKADTDDKMPTTVDCKNSSKSTTTAVKRNWKWINEPTFWAPWAGLLLGGATSAVVASASASASAGVTDSAGQLQKLSSRQVEQCIYPEPINNKYTPHWNIRATHP